MNAWGCDRCQQMMPAAPPSGYGPMPGQAPGRGGGFSHMPQTQAEKTRTFILLGVLIVAVIGVIIMLASDSKKKGDEGDDGEAPGVEATGEPADTAPPPAPQPQQQPQPQQPAQPAAPAAGQVTTPKGAPITIPECAEVATMRKQIDSCAAISAESKKTLDEMADNKMSVFDNGAPSGDYADMVRGKCAGTVDAFKQSLDQAGCK
jgi:hypothetical protein